MNPTRLSLALSFPLLLTGLAAQTVQASLEALQPLVAKATSGAGQISQSSVPAGPLGPSGSVGATPSIELVAVGAWNSTVGDSAVILNLSQVIFVSAGSTGSASVGPFEFRVSLGASSPTNARIELSRVDFLTGGVGATTMSVDLNDDGQYEIANLATSIPGSSGSSFPGSSSSSFAFSRPLGAAPHQFRVRISSQATAPGASNCSLRIRVLPDTGITTTPTAVDCSPNADVQFTGFPVFSNSGYVLRAIVPYFSRPAVMVVGLAQQPILLPQIGPVPCLLVPRPDVLLPVLPSQVVTLDIPLPPSVRPVTLQGQLVFLEAQGQLSVSDAWAVSAQ